MHSTLAVVSVFSLLFMSVTTKPVIFSQTQISSRQQTLLSCLSAHNVPTRLATSSDWSGLVAPYNLRLAYTPAAVTLPVTPQHVSDSVTCAAAAGVKVQAKSGGHSYASFSSGGKDGSLIIDLQEFNLISVDNSTFIAAVGGGVRLGNLALGIYAQLHRALPHGTCPGVGVGGHFTHGGYGYDSRLWGLALDAIVAMDVVLANGSFVHATSSSYPQIFFALRGAADSFGIITTFYLQTLPAPPSVINFSVSIPATLGSASTAANAFLSLQNFVLTSPYVNRNITFGIYTDGIGFSLSGWYFGDQIFFTNTILPAMLAGFPVAQATSIKSLSWLDSLVNEAGGQLSEPQTGYSAHDTFYAKSVVTHNAQPLTLEALDSFWSYVMTQGRSSAYPWFSIINLYGGLDSQINAKPIIPSAYSDRDALWVFQNYGYTSNSQPPFNAAITTLIDGLNDALTSAQPTGNFGAYLNYVDPDLTATQAADLYYGASLYSQLVQLKNIVDPDAVFWNPQAIGNANSASSSSTRPAPSSPSSPAKPTSTMKISTDGTCGSSKSATCLGSSFGNCCSSAGWCGNTSAWCGTGCQASFGSCSSTSPVMAKSSTSKSSPSLPTSTLMPSVDGSCGGTIGHTCIGSNIVEYGEPACCSQYGWCGSTTAYCGHGCQSKFGTCSSPAKKARWY